MLCRSIFPTRKSHETTAKNAKREKSRKLGEKRERGFAFEAPDTFRMVVFSDFERMYPFRDFAARHEVTQGVSKSEGLAICVVFV